MNFLNTTAGKWLVIMLVLVAVAYLVWRKFGGTLKDAAKEGASFFNVADQNNNSYKTATKLGQAVTGSSSWSLSDLFPKSAAEKQVDIMLGRP